MDLLLYASVLYLDAHVIASVTLLVLYAKMKTLIKIQHVRCDADCPTDSGKTGSVSLIKLPVK